MSLQFEWDPQKAISNEKKHGVSFEEATTVFSDQLSATFADPNHSDDEDRYIIIGLSQQQRLLMVAHTEIQDQIRLISSRELTAIERKQYEKSF